MTKRFRTFVIAGFPLLAIGFSVAAAMTGNDGKTIDQRKSDWVSGLANQNDPTKIDFSPQTGRQYVLAWAEAGTHGSNTCRSQGVLIAAYDPTSRCLNADGDCSLSIDFKTGVEKIAYPGGGSVAWNDLMCIDGNIPGLIWWNNQSGSFAPVTLARLRFQYNYPNSELQQLFKDIAGDEYFFDASPSDTQGSVDMQPLKTAVHYLAAMQSPGASVKYADRGQYFSRAFSYGGRSYVPGGGPYNALTFTRDWLYALMDSILKKPNAETNSASYQSRAVSAFRLLYDFGEPDMKTRAKMSLDALFLDAGMQLSLGANQWGGLLGRTYRSVYEGGWGDTMPWYVYWGAKSMHHLTQEGYVSSYRLPSLVEEMPYLDGSEWLLKRDSYRNNVFNTNLFVLAAGPDGGEEWRVVVRRGDGGNPFEFWINDYAGDLDGNACSAAGQQSNGRTVSTCGGGECYSCLGASGSLYRNNILLENLGNPVMHLSSGGQSFDQVQGKLQATGQWKNEYWLNNGQWNYLREGNTAIAVNPGPGTGGIEVARIDPSCSEDFCYSSFQDFTSRSRSVGSGSFTNGKGVVINRSKTYTRAPGRLIASSGDSPNLVSWNNNVMTVSRGGQSCTYDFNSWTYSGGGCGGGGGGYAQASYYAQGSYSTPPPPPPSSCNGPITLYQHTNFTGYSAGFGSGSYSTSQLGACGVLDNDVSSLKVPAGYQATLYDNDGVSGLALTRIADDLTLVDDGWNDRLSSLKVEATGTPPPPPPGTKPGDLNGDGVVNVTDLGVLLSAWGRTDRPPADINQDGKVDVVDLGILLSNWQS